MIKVGIIGCDFKKQTRVFTGAQELLTKIFVGKKFTVMTPLEAELTKYMHNVFGAYKVCGRLADFRYYNMDQCLERNLNVVNELLQ